MLAVTNSALAQIVMASRVLYGMAKQGRAPVMLARVHASRQTPLAGTVVVTAAILLLALLFPLLTLAKATSFIILCIFVIINVSLIYLKLAGEVARRGLWIPVLGALLSAALLGSSVF
jgi:amino acid transporter